LSAAVSARPDGIRLMIRLTPAGGADALDGEGEDSNGQAFLKARVRAAPEDGKANAALEALIAKALGAPKSAVRVARGAKSRLKTIDVSGDPQDLLSRAQALLKPRAEN
jgi:uncharacterized protein YggU (UPF0235/DUF167 family)